MVVLFCLSFIFLTKFLFHRLIDSIFRLVIVMFIVHFFSLLIFLPFAVYFHTCSFFRSLLYLFLVSNLSLPSLSYSVSFNVFYFPSSVFFICYHSSFSSNSLVIIRSERHFGFRSLVRSLSICSCL